jgi:drug/metabolite transporter (DMT)-like permease
MEVKTLISAVILSVVLSLESVIIRLLNVKKYSVPSEQMVILVDIFKCLVSLCLYYYQKIKYQEYDLIRNEDEIHGWNWKNLYYYIFPAVIYTISNNVTYFALSEMTPAMYNLLMNIKIPLTGLMTFVFLKYEMSQKFIISFLVLFSSTTLASLNFTDNISLDVSMIGLLYMLIYTICSSGGAVLMEYITKIKFKSQDIYIQNVKFSLMSVLCNAIVILVKFKLPFTNLVSLHWIVVIISGIYGLITAVVIKFGGSILKTYSVSCSVFLSALLSYLVWGTTFTWNFFVGSICCVYAVHLYVNELYKMRTLHTQEVYMESDLEEDLPQPECDNDDNDDINDRNDSHVSHASHVSYVSHIHESCANISNSEKGQLEKYKTVIENMFNKK